MSKIQKKTVLAPSTQRSVKNSAKVVVQPYIQKVEKHIQQNKTVPSVQRSVKNIDKTVVKAYIQKVEKHIQQNKTAPSTQPASLRGSVESLSSELSS